MSYRDFVQRIIKQRELDVSAKDKSRDFDLDEDYAEEMDNKYDAFLNVLIHNSYVKGDISPSYKSAAAGRLCWAEEREAHNGEDVISYTIAGRENIRYFLKKTNLKVHENCEFAERIKRGA